jgi:AAA15 family ATPase/GTPase
MENKIIVRLIKTEIYNFKNVSFGEVKYMNYNSLNRKAVFRYADIVGLYGQNGSGKTALVEALDVVRYVLSGKEIPYDSYSGLLDASGNTKLTSTFFVETSKQKYKVCYEIGLKADNKERKINVFEEKLTYWIRGSTWKSERDLFFKNPYYENDNILEQANLSIQSKHTASLRKIAFLASMQTLAAVCAAEHISVFFNNKISKALNDAKSTVEIEARNLSDVIECLMKFSMVDFHVIKVNQLGAINESTCIPLNIRCENNKFTMQACLPLFLNGQGEIPRSIFELFKKTINAINITLKSIIPNLQIEIAEKSNLSKPDGQEYVQVEVYSNRNGKRFLTRYESEGIKRIVSLLHFFIAVYNNPSVCLVVDELDSGIFEYLLGELLDVLQMEMKGQLIFTSHNLRALEILDKSNIVCSTTNPNNRYIRLTGVNKHNNRRDFYIRSITIGGQQEQLYEDENLQLIGYAFRKAGKVSTESAIKSVAKETLSSRADIKLKSGENKGVF